MKQGIKVLFTLAMASLLWSTNAAAGDQGSVYLSPGLMYYQAPKRAEIGITDSLVRLSVGVEDVNDLIAELEEVLGNT